MPILEMHNKQKFFFGAKAVLSGLLIAQIIATLHVYLSNVHLLSQITDIINAGYQAAPNKNVLPQLKQFDAAFFGGIFFTLTTGAFLSLISFSYAFIWVRIFSRKQIFLTPAIVLLAILIWAVNSNGINLMASAYFLLVPFAVFWISLKTEEKNKASSKILYYIFNFSTLLILIALWTYQIDSKMFVDFRDKLLLTNKAGIKINDFYYKYTLYPAEAFKSLDQKLLKTLTLDQIRDKKLANKLESNLAAYNYLNISESNAADLSLINKADKLFLNRGSKTLVETNLEEFLARPKTALKIFSKKSDSNLFFRRFTFVSLIIGLPLFIYLFFHSCINYISTRFLSINASNIIASVFCLIIGLMLLLPFHLSRQKHYEVETANELILSDNWQERMEGLKIIYEKGLSIDDYPSYNKSIVSPYIPERYWLAMALGNGTGEGGVKDLLTLLDDPHPNVACKAYYSIAKRKNTVMIPLLKEKLNKSENWYVQMYIYNALTELGWKQQKSN